MLVLASDISDLFTYCPKDPISPSKLAILRTRTPAIQVQTLPLEGPRVLRVLTYQKLVPWFLPTRPITQIGVLHGPATLSFCRDIHLTISRSDENSFDKASEAPDIQTPKLSKGLGPPKHSYKHQTSDSLWKSIDT